MNINELNKKFSAEDVKWRIGRCGKNSAGKVWAMALAYIDGRAIQERFDSVCGKLGWRNEYTTWKTDSQLCGVSVYDDEKKEWVTKWDGSDDSDFEKTKGGLSNSMKRAATQWGIGRYLYSLPETFVVVGTTKANGWVYQSASPKCEAFYWKIPELPAWALPETKVHETQPPPTKKKEKDPSFIYDANNTPRYDKTTFELDASYQSEHSLIDNIVWREIKGGIEQNLGGNIKQFAAWLMGVYKVKFYDIKADAAAGILKNLKEMPKEIMEYKAK